MMMIGAVVLVVLAAWLIYYVYFKKKAVETPVDKPVVVAAAPAATTKTVPYQEVLRYTNPISEYEPYVESSSAPQYDAELVQYDEFMTQNEWTDNFSASTQPKIFFGSKDNTEPYHTKENTLTVMLKHNAANLSFIIFTKTQDLVVNIYNNENRPIFNIRRDGTSLITNGLTKTNVLYNGTKLIARFVLSNNRLYVNGKFISEYKIQPIKTITLQSEGRGSKSLFIKDELVFI